MKRKGIIIGSVLSVIVCALSTTSIWEAQYLAGNNLSFI
jgi:hypothetical protein